MDKKEIGRLIFNCRAATGESQEVFGQRFNVSQQAVNNWESGRTLPGKEIADVLCEVIGMDPANIDILRHKGKKTKQKAVLVTGTEDILMSQDDTELCRLLVNHGTNKIKEDLKNLLLEIARLSLTRSGHGNSRNNTNGANGAGRIKKTRGPDRRTGRST